MSRERIRELEAELAAARKTIEVLVRRQERSEPQDLGAYAAFQSMARLEALVEERTRSLAASQVEIQRYSDGLEARVAQRTEELRASMQRFQELFDNAAEGILTLDPQGHIEQVNPESLRVTGLAKEDLIGRSAIELIHPDDQERLMEAVRPVLRGGESALRGFPARVCLGEGQELHLEINAAGLRDGEGNPDGAQISARDVSVRTALQDALTKSQKMETLGRLAAGVAHDFNNVLAAVLPAVERIQADVTEDHALHPYVQSLALSVRHATGLTSQLLTFTRHGTTDERSFDPVAAIDEALSLTAALFEGRPTVERELAPVPAVRMDPIRFEQVLLNLLVNAREAQGDQGSVQVGCDLATVETSTGFVLPCPAGRYVRMVVADEGPGMVPEVVARAFEPLFTTRSSANGTGLGLAVVLAAVEQADGGIRLTTAPGEGARFEIFLPPAQTVDEASSELRAEGAPACLLVVEDDDGLRRVVVDLLREQGDEVLAAADGETALRLLPTHGARLDAVLLDLQLGRVSGGEVFAAIREAYPALPVLLTSGFIDAEEREALLRAPLTAFLPKPYRVATLTRALRSLRSQSSPG